MPYGKRDTPYVKWFLWCTALPPVLMVVVWCLGKAGNSGAAGAIEVGGYLAVLAAGLDLVLPWIGGVLAARCFVDFRFVAGMAVLFGVLLTMVPAILVKVFVMPHTEGSTGAMLLCMAAPGSCAK